MSSEKKNSVAKVVGVTAAAAGTAYCGYSYYVFRTAFDLKHSSFYSGRTGNRHLTSKQYSRGEWFSHCLRDDDFLDSYDGLKLHGLRLTNHPEDHKWVVFMPDTLMSPGTVLEYLYQFDEKGFNVLTVDPRGTGMSDGSYTGLGWPEHYDLISWVNYLTSVDSQAEIALVGSGIGAAAVMNAAGDYLPDAVKCGVEIGGFTGIEDLLLGLIQKQCKLNGRMFLPAVNLLVKQNLHFSLDDVSTKRQLKQTRMPMLFVHGREDQTVPWVMGLEAYNACASEKDIYLVDGADSRNLEQGEEYFPKVLDWLKQYFAEAE